MKKTIGAPALALFLAGCTSTDPSGYMASAQNEGAQEGKSPRRELLDRRIAHHAAAYKIPESLIHAVVQRESKYNPTLRHGPYWGLMQIRHDTARSMGYTGPAAGLLDAETNLTYAVAYLANAYRVAQGDERRAVRLYASGYYFEAKRRGLLGAMRPALIVVPKKDDSAAPAAAPAAPQTEVASER